MGIKSGEDYKTGMGQRIKSRRKELKMTQEELAEYLGISVKHVSETERGLSGLSVDNLIRLCDLFGVTLDYLIRGETIISRWQLLIPQLESTPPGKADELYRLIQSGIRLLQN